MRLVILGPPGAGKGTQAKDISEKLEVPHISSGDIFRGEINAGTKRGRKLQEYVDAGQLVPDDVTTEIVVDRLRRDDCADGYLLDGFPRTQAQAERLDRELSASGATLDAAVYLDLAAEKVSARMAGRRMCRQCGASYHLLTLKPKVEGVCDRCGGELYQRNDDKPETVKDRLDVYFESTAPLVDYYQARGLLKRVDADGTPEEVRSRVFDGLGIR